MKTVILAGGLPSTIEGRDEKIPKPMAAIGERPLLWHIMKLFSHYGCNDFIICAGFRSDIIKEYFLNYYVYSSDITVHLQSNKVDIHNKVTEPWKVSIINTGLTTATAERIYRILSMVDDDFFVVYGDCISNVDVSALEKCHAASGKLMTVVLAKPGGRNSIVSVNASGELLPGRNIDAGKTASWVNACIMAVSPKVFGQAPQPGEKFETEIVHKLAARSQVNTYRHDGFWRPIETMRDKDQLQAMWDAGKPPWKIWKD